MRPSFATCLLSAALLGALAGCASVEAGTVELEGFWMSASGATEGPTVLVFAGGRKDQEMPRLAVRQIAGWPLQTGRLISVSIASEALPPGFEDFVAGLAPDWVLELREDFYHRRPGMETLGGSVVHKGGAQSAHLAEVMSASVNLHISEEANRFRGFERAGVSRVCEGAGMVLVTSARENTTPTVDHRKAPLVRRHRWMVHAFLGELGMLPENSHPDRGLTGAAPGALHFAIYDGEGSGRPLPFITDVQNGVPESVGYPLGPEEMAAGALEGFDVVLFPGGMASHQFDALGESGREAVVEFVRGGGGYVGICAGAFMAASDPYQWGLNLLDARIVDHDHWARGIGPVEMELSDAGKGVFGDFDGMLTLHYGQGPIVEPAGREDLPDYEVLGWYRTGIGENGADPAVMVDTPAIVCARYGEGRVLVSSGHAEWSSGLESFLLRYFEWASGRAD